MAIEMDDRVPLPSAKPSCDQPARERGTLLWLREAKQGLQEAAQRKGRSLPAMKKKWLEADG